MAEWKKEDIDRVRDLAKTGITAKEIASHFEGRSRMSIIGLCHRQGIPLLVRGHRFVKRDDDTPRPPRTRVKSKVKQPPKLIPQPPLEASMAYKPGNKTMMQLDNLFLGCRAIIGPVQGIHTVYCGEAVLAGKSWCKDHFVLYTAPVQTRRVDRENFRMVKRYKL